MNNVAKTIYITLISIFVLLFLLCRFFYDVDLSSLFKIAIICGILIGLLYYIIKIYNNLVFAKNNIENNWSQIDVLLKKRMDLIPNIVETVKGYAGHENETFVDIAKARAGLEVADTVKDVGEANNMLTNTLKSLFVVVENYPELKANSNIQNLQNQLSAIEEIANQRIIFNNSVMEYNSFLNFIG